MGSLILLLINSELPARAGIMFESSSINWNTASVAWLNTGQ